MSSPAVASKTPSLDEKNAEDVEKAGVDVQVFQAGADDMDIVLAESQYTEEQYAKLKRKIDRYLLPLMWLCYGIQQTDKTSLGTQANFGLREDTGLVGNQYSWLSTIFYLMYLFFEFPSNLILQRWKMGKTLSIYMLCWGVIVLCIGFAQNWAQLMALRALQGLAECCISPGFILVIGSWYKTREHPSRALFFQSANAGFGVIADLILYGIGSRTSGDKSWRAMSYFLGGLTIVVGTLCLFLLGTPSEVPWLTEEERRMANARIVSNQTGHDRTGVKNWKWAQVREALTDATFWFTGLNAFLSSVPNGGLTTFGSILNKSFGFTSLEVILYGIPRSVFSVLWFIFIGIITTRIPNLRLIFMAFCTLPSMAGFLGISLLPNEPAYKWSKWGCYFMTVPFVVGLFMSWTLIPSNVAGRTKRTITSSFTFVGYCVGNMVGTQIFLAKDAPKYTAATTVCAVCFAAEFVLCVCWRLVYMRRNRLKDAALAKDGLTEEERIAKGKEYGESDTTDFENPYLSGADG
ncbi:MFS general substrate transporter [Stereum hirsutum FP-91666 SS1]|uniref:MFS general substrate transporter n=1 Tax=Stereum hirsutum (strain FP-91666) TaxID=721885 RepID=UPI000440BC0A|nr:MFS general substrate transporter [Stereum hirsutum FP-91666 SS1]EIM89633.1 MFS general substrate transporter [Stereum hirsutum FP-91666 SS1]